MVEVYPRLHVAQRVDRDGPSESGMGRVAVMAHGCKNYLQADQGHRDHHVKSEVTPRIDNDCDSGGSEDRESRELGPVHA
jgi:hypothetical protein